MHINIAGSPFNKSDANMIFSIFFGDIYDLSAFTRTIAGFGRRRR